MKPLGISINGLALELHVPVTRISQIVNERRGITADTALRLARHFGTRRFLDECSEGIRVASDPAQVVEDDRETGPAAHGRSLSHGT